MLAKNLDRKIVIPVWYPDPPPKKPETRCYVDKLKKLKNRIFKNSRFGILGFAKWVQI